MGVVDIEPGLRYYSPSGVVKVWGCLDGEVECENERILGIRREEVQMRGVKKSRRVERVFGEGSIDKVEQLLIVINFKRQKYK